MPILMSLLLLVLLTLPASTAPSPVDGYNYVIGTQTIGPAYQFTRETKLLETARAITHMGSNTIKFALHADNALSPKPQTLAEIAEHDPSVQAVFAMPFAHYLLWAYAIGLKEPQFTPPSYPAEYKQVYDLARYLLAHYSHTHKTFYLGNWEGDWHLLRTNPATIPTATEIANFTGWFNIRQKAVDDAKRDTPHAGVNVYYYMEVNRVDDAMHGKPRLANLVLPHTDVDFVSYSSYDTLGGGGTNLRAALDYLQSQLPPKPGLTGKRVFIGEYGFPAVNFTPAAQDARSRAVMRIALAWGCPFCLYWEMYNNEVTPDHRQRGFWLINDQGEKQPVYETHRQFYAKAHAYVANFYAKTGRVPTRAEYGQAAAGWLSPPAP